MNTTYILLIVGGAIGAAVLFFLLRPDKLIGRPISFPGLLSAPPSAETLNHLNRDQVRRIYIKETGDKSPKTKPQMIDVLTEKQSARLISPGRRQARLKQDDVDLRVKRVSVTYEPLHSPRALINRIRGKKLEGPKGRWGQRKMSTMERRHLDNYAEKHLPADFDLEAHIDPELTYAENRDNLEKFEAREGSEGSEVKSLAKTSKRQRDQFMSQVQYEQAKTRHAMRSEESKDLDEHIQAQTQHDPKDIPDSWFNQPNMSDVPGIDDHVGMRLGAGKSQFKRLREKSSREEK